LWALSVEVFFDGWAAFLFLMRSENEHIHEKNLHHRK
jgi:hypothetical protein